MPQLTSDCVVSRQGNHDCPDSIRNRLARNYIGPSPNRQRSSLFAKRCHSDVRSQFTSVRYGQRLAEIGAVPSIGSIGDSFDNALAEAVNGYYNSELIYGPARPGPWKTVDDVELATLGWVHWRNATRPHGYLNDIPPAEFEATFYAPHRTDQPLVEIQ